MSLLSKTAKVAHSAAASILAKPVIRVGTALPSVMLKDQAGKATVSLNSLKGKNIILGVPGAFTPSCSNQVPGYIEAYEKFKSKGVDGIYVVAVNDAFVMKAWGEKLAPKGSLVKFLSDDKAEFVSELGLVFDASEALGGPRSKRFALVTEGGKVTKINVEDAPPNVTVTTADSLLKDL
ncbi:hypothetical protein FRB94_009008 [Tulasnella sp. JGI-2019a]|nr:hypothetical protein FRB93_003463 [Tulasnella sp. JGI-2019a]KAG9014850.1 hypothetical protein FRB94_009008 [Tulasnella sp. JGI-2019a]KAG9039990.1 hypothetical protein FRB95_004462 [Tulasnella sp. JGI-2019a]